MKFKNIIAIILTIITIALLSFAIVGVVFGCNYSLILLIPAVATSIYPIKRISNIVINKLKLKNI